MKACTQSPEQATLKARPLTNPPGWRARQKTNPRTPAMADPQLNRAVRVLSVSRALHFGRCHNTYQMHFIFDAGFLMA